MTAKTLAEEIRTDLRKYPLLRVRGVLPGGYPHKSYRGKGVHFIDVDMGDEGFRVIVLKLKFPKRG